MAAGHLAGQQAVRIRLQPFDLTGTVELASAVLSKPVSQRLATHLHRHTDGVPLAVEESLRVLSDRGDLEDRHGRWDLRDGADMPVPLSVRDSIMEHLRRLPPPAQRLLRAAAVLAEPAHPALLAEVAAAPPDASLPGGSACAAGHGLLAESADGTVRFRRALAAAAIYESIPAPQRRQLHKRAGRALERAGAASAATLAHHFRNAGEVVAWQRYGEQAAAAAAATGDHRGAVDLLAALLAFPELATPDQVRLAGRLADALLFTNCGNEGRPGPASLRRVRDNPALDPGQRAAVRAALGRLLHHRGAYAEAAVELEAAVSNRADQSVSAAHSMTLLGWPVTGSDPASAHRRWLRRAAAVPLSTVTPAQRLEVKLDRAAALLQLGAPEGWQAVADLPSWAGTVTERHHLARGLAQLGECAIRWGRYGPARRMLTAALRMAPGDGSGNDQVRISLAGLDWLTGRGEEPAEWISRLAGDTDAPPGTRRAAGMLLARGELARGDLRRCQQRLEAVRDDCRRHGAALAEVDAAALLARLLYRRGEIEAASRVTDDPVRSIATRHLWIWAGDLAPMRVAALLAGGRVDEAEQLVSRFANGLRGRQAPGPLAGLATCRALLAEQRHGPQTAARAFGRAAAAWRALPHPYQGCELDERRAVCLLAAGKLDEGLGLLARVRDTLTVLGAVGDAERVERLSRAHGGAAQPWRGGPHGYGDRLSPRELEVVRLVATGRTNRQIARELSKSPGTVAEQLRSAMRKLGVVSRTGLAVAAVETGLVREP